MPAEGLVVTLWYVDKEVKRDRGLSPWLNMWSGLAFSILLPKTSQGTLAPKMLILGSVWCILEQRNCNFCIIYVLCVWYANSEHYCYFPVTYGCSRPRGTWTQLTETVSDTAKGNTTTSSCLLLVKLLMSALQSNMRSHLLNTALSHSLTCQNNLTYPLSATTTDTSYNRPLYGSSKSVHQQKALQDIQHMHFNFQT